MKNIPSMDNKSINKSFVLLSAKSGFYFFSFSFDFTLTLFRLVHSDSHHA